MDNLDAKLDQSIARRVKTLRMQHDLTLEQLAEASGVSRAMISKIERGEASPTAALLNRLCAAFDVSLSGFFSNPERQSASPLSRRDQQTLWRDPDTGYQRWAVSPPGTGSPIDIVEISFPPRKRVTLPPMAANRGLTQHIWLLEGAMELSVNAVTYLMTPGDCLFMDVGDALVFHNPGPATARYAVIYNGSRRLRKDGDIQ